ncbi:TIR domain-containing protein [Mesorhizobium sp. M0913]|uniref:nSTAND1 domain-containing NTPase n=1 Tax=Mesorhizobium sp. M0913 TaxID=2957026 RepID=UPI00333B48AE
MARIFLSHSSRNNAQAIALRDWLVANGWGRDDVFLDIDATSGIAPGERWQKALNEAANRCEAVIFLISQPWLASQWCHEELALAHKLNKRLFGILIDTVDVAGVPARLRDEWQLIDLESGRDGIRLDVELPNGQQGFATYSASGLDRLRAGLVKAGLDPRFFAWPPASDPRRAPYRGLAPMEAEDAGIFYGREAATIAALDQLRGLAEAAPARLMAVLGASGAGKSSFMRAGLIPRLKRDDRNFLVLPILRPERAAITGKTGLIAAIMTAGQSLGLKCTRAKVNKAVAGDPEDVAMLFSEVAEAALRRISGSIGESAPAIILPIDQGEELFLAQGQEEARALLTLLAALLKFERLGLIALVTIRTDSYEKLQLVPVLSEIRQVPFNLPALARGAYQRVIEGPAERMAGSSHALRIEPALTAALLADTEEGGAKDALPLLAFTLERLFADHGGDGDLTLAEYRQSGGISGAIEAAVERALSAADADPGVPRDRLAKLALLRRAMIPWLAGIDPETKTARRQVARFTDIPDEARPLIEYFVEQRLLATDASAITGERTIEPAHEALLRQWGLIDDWLKEDIAVLATLEGVRRASRDWDSNARDNNWLAHSGGRLEDAEAIKSRVDLARRLDAADLAYLDAARAAEMERRDRELQDARQLAEEQSKRAEAIAQLARQQKMVAKRTRIGAIVATVFAIVALAGAFYGFRQAKFAEQAAALANEQQAKANIAAQDAKANETVSLAALSREALSENLPGYAVKLALAAWPRAGDGRRPALRRTIASLGEALTDYRERLILKTEGSFQSAAFSPDGKHIITASSDKTARVWDATTGEQLMVLAGHKEQVNSAAFAPDGRRIVTGSNDNTARVWDAVTGAQIIVIDGARESASFSPDGMRIVAVSLDGTARVWDATTGEQLMVLSGQKLVTSASFSPDGKRLVTASGDETARVWDATTGVQTFVLHGHKQLVGSALFSPDGTRIITASGDKTARVWDANTGAQVMVLNGHQDYVQSAAFSPDGMRIVTTTRDKTTRVWDANTGAQIMALKGHEGSVNSAAFSPNGTRVVTASLDKTVRVWDVAIGASVLVLGDHENSFWSAVYSPDGNRIVTTAPARVWDAATGARELILWNGSKAEVMSAAFSPDGTRIIVASDDKTASVWGATTGQRMMVLIGHVDLVRSAVFSPDGRRIVTGSDDRTARVWDASSGKQLIVLAGHKGGVNSVEFSPDGRRIVTASGDETARIWDAATGEQLMVLAGHKAEVRSAAFSPDGTRIATASSDNTARLWDATNGAQLLELAGHDGAVFSAGFSRDGTRIVSTSWDKTARVWDAKTGAQLAMLSGHDEVVASATFSPDGMRIVTASPDMTARIWDISSLEKGDAFQIACRLIGKNTNLSDAEARYGLSNLAPICGDNPPFPVDIGKLLP